MLLKIKLIKQDNAGHLFYFIFFLTNKTKAKSHTHIHTRKKDKKRKRDEITCCRPSPFSF